MVKTLKAVLSPTKPVVMFCFALCKELSAVDPRGVSGNAGLSHQIFWLVSEA